MVILVPLWIVMFVFFWAARQRHRWLQAVMRMMPLFRGYSKNRSVADLCFTLGAYFAAGESIDNAWYGAGRASGDRRLAKLGEKIATAAKSGTAPGTVLAESRGLPEEFFALYSTGEQTGQLEENVHHLGLLFAERATSKLQQACLWYPKLLILLVAIGVAYVAITTYMGYLQEVLNMLE